MNILIVGQEPLEVSEQEARAVLNSITSGAEYIIVGSEYVKATAIMGIRKGNEELPKSAWGMLPEGRLDHFFDDRREYDGEGYKKFQELKQKLLNK